MVADRAGTSGSCQALLMMMRVAIPVGRRIARVLLVRPFAALVWLGSCIVIWFDHTQPSPSLPMASTGHPSMASLQTASSSGVVGCLNT
jgi:hypothetical protein